MDGEVRRRLVAGAASVPPVVTGLRSRSAGGPKSQAGRHLRSLPQASRCRPPQPPPPAADMSKTHWLAGLEGPTIDSAVHEFRADYEQIKDADFNMPFRSDVFSAGGHMCQVSFFPCGDDIGQAKYPYLSIVFELVSKSRGVSTIFEAFLLHRDGQPRHVPAGTSRLHRYEIGDHECGWMHTILRSNLEREYVTDGHFTFICVVMVVCDRSIPLPASNMGKHFGSLLDSSDGTDVSFVIGTETFHAHRAVLAARSAVFKAELFGPMAESTIQAGR